MGWILGILILGGLGLPPSSKLLRSLILNYLASSAVILAGYGSGTGAGGGRACTTGLGYKGAGYFLCFAYVHPISICRINIL